MTVVGDGCSTLFWQDSWIHGCCVDQIAPTVFASVPQEKARIRSVALGLADHAWVSNITGAQTIHVFLQYLDLWERVRSVQLMPGVPDSVIWHWSADHKYSVASVYGAMFIGLTSPLGAKLIWETRAPPKRAAGIVCSCILLAVAGLALACCCAAGDAGGELMFDVVSHGARGDGSTDDTKAFEAAWDAACGARGPSVVMVVPAQRSFLVGPVSFQGPCASGRVTVQIQGTIMAPLTAASAWSSGTNLYWLMFNRVDGLRVTGNGVLDGSGQSWWVRRCHSDAHAACVESAPTALKLVSCNNLELSQFSSRNSPQMHIAIIECSGVNVWGLNVAAPGNSPNTDGVHVERSQGVRITNSTIGTGDDCVSISSGSRFVTVDGIQCGPGHGVSIGSLAKNGEIAAVEYIDVKNVYFTNTANGARIKTWEGAQGYARSISFTDIEFDNVDHPVIIDQFYRDRTLEVRTLAVAISNVTYTNLKGTSSLPTAVAFDCSGGGSCTDIHVNSVMITRSGGQQTFARCRNAQVSISGQVYPEIPCH
ncbi:polygalacturonase-like [Miscanthus floridulus]|uniref:polygalacturonase-like n=1 Tax=Miscanthus floridulus TaxID=154761 RepID=UPI003458C6C5